MEGVRQLFEPPGRAAVETFSVIGPPRTVRQTRVFGVSRHGNQIEVSKWPSRFEFGLHRDCVYEHFADRMTHGLVKA